MVSLVSPNLTKILVKIKCLQTWILEIFGYEDFNGDVLDKSRGVYDPRWCH